MYKRFVLPFEWFTCATLYIYNIKNKTYFNWSTGKDAALAFHYLRQNNTFSIDRVLTSINKHHQRVSMHGLRVELMERQLEQLKIPSQVLQLPAQPSMKEYDTLMAQAVNGLRKDGFTHAGFGDIFLEDLRDYREKQLKQYGMKSVFPLWKRSTTELIHEFIDLSFRAIVICAKEELLGTDFVGTEIDKNFLTSLPEGVDPCGENGEFHTFCFDGPIFSKPVGFSGGGKKYREYDNRNNNGKTGFWILDLV